MQLRLAKPDKARYDPSMRPTQSGVITGVVLCGVVLALLWTIASDTRARPYAITAQQLTGWTIVPGEGSDPWVLALRPPNDVAEALYAELAQKSATAWQRPSHTELPLVLRGEYEEGLQGVYGVDALAQIAQDADLEHATLTPVCIGHRISHDRHAELVFVIFESAEFLEMRRDLIPMFPEHAGTGLYDPRTLTPVLPLALNHADFSRWWPLIIDRATDCQAPLRAE
jgi:hypothetical protein